MSEAKNLGFQTGLHTGAPDPEALRKLIPWLDWVGLDFKAPFCDYRRVTGRDCGKEVERGFGVLFEAGLPLEIRTTWHPALLSEQDLTGMAAWFGTIPEERIHAHDWKNGVTRVGVIPAERVRESTNGAADWDIPVDLNSMLVDEPWDLIINIGHVVPHEVLGFANHNKNYFIGLGGKELICASHIAAAAYGIENNLGNLITPLRACYNWAEEQFLSHLPDVYFQIVMQRNEANELVTSGIYVGDDLETYLQAARTSRAQNITVFEKPVKKIVPVMQGDEFFATWVANKAVYRTRMAMADGGELLIIAPGVKRLTDR